MPCTHTHTHNALMARAHSLVLQANLPVVPTQDGDGVDVKGDAADPE